GPADEPGVVDSGAMRGAQEEKPRRLRRGRRESLHERGGKHDDARAARTDPTTGASDTARERPVSLRRGNGPGDTREGVDTHGRHARRTAEWEAVRPHRACQA